MPGYPFPGTCTISRRTAAPRVPSVARIPEACPEPATRAFRAAARSLNFIVRDRPLRNGA